MGRPLGLRNMTGQVLGILLLSTFLIAKSFADQPLECEVNGTGPDVVVEVKMVVPHPLQMAIMTPDRGLIWLRGPEVPYEYPHGDDFGNMPRFVLNARTQGTWFNDWSEPEVIQVLGEQGTYVLHIADNIEDESRNNAAFSCEFTLPDGGVW